MGQRKRAGWFFLLLKMKIDRGGGQEERMGHKMKILMNRESDAKGGEKVHDIAVLSPQSEANG